MAELNTEYTESPKSDEAKVKLDREIWDFLKDEPSNSPRLRASAHFINFRNVVASLDSSLHQRDSYHYALADHRRLTMVDSLNILRCEAEFALAYDRLTSLEPLDQNLKVYFINSLRFAVNRRISELTDSLSLEIAPTATS